MRIHVIFATTGRAEVLGKVLTRLTDQTRAPDGVLVVGTCPADVAGVENTFPGLQIIISEKGLCSQRNAGLAALGDHADVVVFFDDDFVPAHDFLEQVEALMSADPGIVGLTGRLVRDGAQTGSLMFEEAVDQLDVQHERPAAGEERMAWLYGCNMAIRLSANPQLRFDEALPLYGWQEDVDFSSRLARHGTLYRTAALTGIHLGVRGGARPACGWAIPRSPMSSICGAKGRSASCMAGGSCCAMLRPMLRAACKPAPGRPPWAPQRQLAGDARPDQRQDRSAQGFGTVTGPAHHMRAAPG